MGMSGGLPTTVRKTLIPGMALLLVGVAHAQQPKPSEAEKVPIAKIIGTIEDFESQKDAKCYATATRLENFIYGTPLSDGARFGKIDLQKALISSVWGKASERAKAQGRDAIGPSEIGSVLSEVLAYRSDGEGNVLVPRKGETLVLAANDIRQYSSIAYALRAILAVQQDSLFLFANDDLPLDDGAVDRLREALDVYTLATLRIADQAARARNEREISTQGFADAWRELLGGPSNDQPRSLPAAIARGDVSTFRTIIDQKIKSYENYNQIDEAKASELFLANVGRFYARFHLPPGGLSLPESLGRVAEDFLAEVLTLAEASTRERGEAILRLPDLNQAVQRATPHLVDDLEDVTFFHRLGKEKQVKLAAFDLDSFRDFGMHWKLLRILLSDPGVDAAVPAVELDPFAAELLAEGMAQYAVLNLRIAGRLAKEEKTYPFFMGKHILAAADEIRNLAALHRDAPEPESLAAPIRSVEGTRPGSGEIFMRDVTEGSGVRFEHRSSNWLNRFRHDISIVPPTFSGGGAAAEDVDGDGRDDLLFVGGIGNALYLSRGEGRFEDVTKRAGITFLGRDRLPGEARQPIIADFDNDGLQDILITYVNETHRLYRNLGDARFEDVSDLAGLGGPGLVGGPAVVFDYDRDGLLDIYICYFGNYLQGYFEQLNTGRQPVDFRGQVPAMNRDNQSASPNRLFRNLGGMRFQDVTETSGTGSRGWTQAASHTDLDGDGWQDLVVANDFGKNQLLRNLGNGRFEDVAEHLGMDKSYHSMNVGLADLNWDGFPEIYISNINMMVKDNRYVLPNESTPLKLGPEAMTGVQIVETSLLYVSVGAEGRLQKYEIADDLERSNDVGWAWDADFFDFDNDGDDDLYVLNGANEYFTFFNNREGPGETAFYWDMEPNVFYVNEKGTLRNYSRQSGADFTANSRSAVFLDIDEDGDLDIAINNFHGPAVIMENSLEASAHWLKVRLQGDPAKGSNRDAIGAVIVAVTPDGKRVWREVHGGSGYLSSEPKTQHLGLGASQRVDLQIRWPNGRTQTVEALSANRTYLIREGEEPVVRPSGGQRVSP